MTHKGQTILIQCSHQRFLLFGTMCFKGNSNNSKRLHNFSSIQLSSIEGHIAYSFKNIGLGLLSKAMQDLYAEIHIRLAVIKIKVVLSLPLNHQRLVDCQRGD